MSFPSDITWHFRVTSFNLLLSLVKQLHKGDKDKEFKAEIQAIYDEHKGNYGYRRIHLELRNRGFEVNHKEVQRLMKLMGLAARIRWKRKYPLTRGRLVRKLIIWLTVTSKVLNLMRSVIQTWQNLLYQTLMRNSICHLSLMATTVKLSISLCHAHLI